MTEYIEREAFFRFLTEQKEKETGAYSKGRNVGLDVARSALHNREIAPAADVAPVVHGRWVAKPQMYRHPNARNYYCSECRYEPTETKKFCPLCGARMDGE